VLVYLQMLDTQEEKNRFEQLYERYNRLMFYVAHKILTGEQDVEDAVHQAYIAILENFHKIGQIDCPQTKAFVVIITERKAIDILRSRERVVDMDFEDAVHGIPVPAPDANGLAEAITKLPARYREVLMLRYYTGYSTQEIAQMLGMRPDSTKRLLSRAKKALENRLDERDD